MRRITACVLAATMVFTMTACTKKDPKPEKETTKATMETVMTTEEAEVTTEEAEVTTEADIVTEAESTEEETMTEAVITTEAETKEEAKKEDASAESALGMLEAIWDSYAEADKFSAAGGDFESMVMDAPGSYALSDAAAIDSTFGVPADKVEMIEEAASLMHMMNANTFTSAAFVLKDGSDAKAFAEAIESNLKGRQWICGFPDKLLIMQSGEIVIMAFGAEDLISVFKEKATAFDAVVICEENMV